MDTTEILHFERKNPFSNHHPWEPCQIYASLEPKWLIFETQPSITKPFPIKTCVLWVLSMSKARTTKAFFRELFLIRGTELEIFWVPPRSNTVYPLSLLKHMLLFAGWSPYLLAVKPDFWRWSSPTLKYLPMIRLAFVHQLAFHEMDGWWVVSMPLVKKTVTTPDKTRARSQVAKDFRITKTSTKNLRIPETKRRSPPEIRIFIFQTWRYSVGNSYI